MAQEVNSVPNSNSYQRHSEEDTKVTSKQKANTNKKEKNGNEDISLKNYGKFGSFITKHEIPRKIFHSSIGFITLYLYTQNVNYKNVKYPLIYGFIIIGALDILRFRWPLFNKAYCATVGILMRQKEIHGYNGVLWYLLGLIFSFSFFSKDVALLSVCLLSWSDTAASTIGRKFGPLTPKVSRNKSLAGSLAAFAVGVVTCVVFYGYFVPHYNSVNRPNEIAWTPESSRLSLFEISWIGGVIASLSEGIDLFDLDDNFTIPFLSSIFLHSVIILARKSNLPLQPAKQPTIVATAVTGSST